MHLNEQTLQILDGWDESGLLIENNFERMLPQLSESGKRAAFRMGVQKGFVSEEESVEKYVSDEFFGHTEDAITYTIRILTQLMRSQNLDVGDIIKLNSGSFCEVLAIGDYVFKIGNSRATEDIPEHPRILEPVLKFKLPSIPGTRAVDTIIEVQPKLSLMSDELGKAADGMYTEELYELYADLRKSGIVWGDVAIRNVGVIDVETFPEVDFLADIREDLRENPNVVMYPSKVGLPRGIEEDELRKLVILDVDYLYLEEAVGQDPSKLPAYLAKKFAERYKSEQELVKTDPSRAFYEAEQRKKALRTKKGEITYDPDDDWL